jgi:hypothetical protein
LSHRPHAGGDRRPLDRSDPPRLFLGARRFEASQFQTGISSHLLSTRLKRREEDGVISRRPTAEHTTRYEYRLTEKGLDFYPVLLALKGWEHGGAVCGGLLRKQWRSFTVTAVIRPISC